MSSPGYIGTFIPSGILQQTETTIVGTVTGGSSSAPGTNGQGYAFYTLPTTFKYYKITGMQWTNGASLAGNVVAGVDIVDSIPPVSANVLTIALAAAVAQTGTSTTQRVNPAWSLLISGGATVGMWISLSSGSGFVSQLAGGANTNTAKGITYTATPPPFNTTAWTASTTHLADTTLYVTGYN